MSTDYLTDEQLRVTALEQSLRFHDGWEGRGDKPQDVLDTAEKFYEFLVKS